MTTPASDVPILDAACPPGSDRDIVDEFGLVEPFGAELDSWYGLPVLLVWTLAGDIEVELGSDSSTLVTSALCALR
ncbi:MAG: hypothetical protein QG597_1872 [Actinomycetota bacterium]|nr:hypothetical protein [Actinomycetota bacterium]